MLWPRAVRSLRPHAGLSPRALPRTAPAIGERQRQLPHRRLLATPHPSHEVSVMHNRKLASCKVILFARARTVRSRKRRHSIIATPFARACGPPNHRARRRSPRKRRHSIIATPFARACGPPNHRRATPFARVCGVTQSSRATPFARACGVTQSSRATPFAAQAAPLNHRATPFTAHAAPLNHRAPRRSQRSAPSIMLAAPLVRARSASRNQRAFRCSAARAATHARARRHAISAHSAVPPRVRPLTRALGVTQSARIPLFRRACGHSRARSTSRNRAHSAVPPRVRPLTHRALRRSLPRCASRNQRAFRGTPARTVSRTRARPPFGRALARHSAARHRRTRIEQICLERMTRMTRFTRMLARRQRIIDVIQVIPRRPR